MSEAQMSTEAMSPNFAKLGDQRKSMQLHGIPEGNLNELG